MKRAVLIAIALFSVIGLSGCGYNDLTAKQQQVKVKWADVESQLQRRADLIPNIIKVAQTAAVQEQEVFGQISEARSRLLNAAGSAPANEKTPEQRQAVMEAANSFGGTVGRLLSLQENYPQLRSSELFLQAQDDLRGTEDRIAVARQDYNKVTGDYNTMRAQFPTVVTASLFGFKEEPLFAADPGAKTAPQVPDPNSIRKQQ